MGLLVTALKVEFHFNRNHRLIHNALQETMSRADEELQGAEDKLNHLSMVKSKLEQTLDDLEDTLDREKRSKADAEKTMRKMETDMKVS